MQGQQAIHTNICLLDTHGVLLWVLNEYNKTREVRFRGGFVEAR